MLAPIWGQHTNALDRAVSDGTIAAPMLRPVRVTGQTGLPVWNGEVRRTIAQGDPVREGARRVVLGSACHLERLQTSWRCKKNSKYGGWKS